MQILLNYFFKKCTPFSLSLAARFTQINNFSTKPQPLFELKNELISKKFTFVRLLDRNSGKLEDSVSVREALGRRPLNHDLVLVDGKQDPPIVRFQAQSEIYALTQQREDAATRARLSNKLKEMHLTTVTDEHDFAVKIDKMDEWIRKGWRVRVVVEEKRKRMSTGLAPTADPKKETMTRLMGKMGDVAEIIGTPEMERGCLIFSLKGNQKIMSQVKKERAAAKDDSDSK